MEKQIIEEKCLAIRNRFAFSDCGTDYIILKDNMKTGYNEMVLFEYSENNGLYFMHYEKGTCFPMVACSLSDEHRAIFHKMMLGARVGHKQHYAVYDKINNSYKYIGEDEEIATKIFNN